MSRVFKRITGTGSGGAIAVGEHIKITPFLQPAKDDVDLLALGVLQRNIFAGGSDTIGIDASASGDYDLLNWTPILLDNTSSQFSSFTDTNSATLVVQVRFLLRVSNALISVTPKLRYGTTITTVTTVAAIAGTAACSGTATDYSGADQYQTVTVTLPASINLFKCQITIGGAPAAGYQAWARAYMDIYVNS